MINDLEKLTASIPWLLIALGLALILVTGFFVSVDLGSRSNAEWMGAFFIGVPLSLASSAIITRRDLSLGEGSVFRPDIADVASGNWVSRGITLVCLVIAIERLARFIVRREYQNARGMGVIALLLAFIGSVNILAAVFGSPGGFTHHLLYAPIVALAVFAYAQRQSAQCIVVVRNTLFVFLLASLLLLLLRPEMVAETHYRAGILPKLSLRYYGFATHPNTLAPLCLLLICSIRLQPYKGSTFNISGFVLSFVSLLLTQSKTSIALVLFGVAWFWLNDRRAAAVGAVNLQKWQARSTTFFFLIAGLMGTVFIAIFLTNGDILEKGIRLAERLQLVTLTGRTQIWAETLRAARENWLFGYGPGLWDLVFRIKVGLPFTHAHNQFIHVFGAAGAVGLVSLVAYLVALARFSWQSRAASRDVSTVLFIYLLLRGFTELPLSVSNAMQGEFIVQLFLLVVCVGAAQVGVTRIAVPASRFAKSRPAARGAKVAA